MIWCRKVFIHITLKEDVEYKLDLAFNTQVKATQQFQTFITLVHSINASISFRILTIQINGIFLTFSFSLCE